MRIAEVIGSVTLSRVHPSLKGASLKVAVPMSLEEAYEAGSVPIREFMSFQIKNAANEDDVELFYHYMDPDDQIGCHGEDGPMGEYRYSFWAEGRNG